MQYYSLYNLIDICVDPTIPSETISSIDFQIEYFKIDKQNFTCPYKIKILNYSNFVHEKQNEEVLFYLRKGCIGHMYHDPTQKLVIQRDDNGYTCYVDKNFLISVPIQLLLLKKNISFVHAAGAVDQNGNVILFPGPGAVGKTAIINHVIKNKGCRLLGDDVIALNKNGECLCFPRKFVLKEYHIEVYPEIFKMLNIKKEDFHVKKEDPRESRKKYLKTLLIDRILIRNLPFVGITKSILTRSNLIQYIRRDNKESERVHVIENVLIDIEKIFGKECIASKGKLRRIIFLERISGARCKIKTIEQDILANKMFSIINQEWVNYMQQLFSLGALEIIDLYDYFKKMKEIITNGITGTNPLILQIPREATYADLQDAYNQIERQL
ncbi:MAG: hypothetical protein UW24_C0016G0002 [Parcubacteria group bacterium GW2011_GWA2_44_12]|nr:MAG: hypothetical protein UW24_C0016G0002 [Parcubacteria group bacterium GW2011_GWA2_44_12]